LLRRFQKAKSVNTIDDLANAVKDGELLNILDERPFRLLSR
jgi:hypothetical protein